MIVLNNLMEKYFNLKLKNENIKYTENALFLEYKLIGENID